VGPAAAGDLAALLPSVFADGETVVYVGTVEEASLAAPAGGWRSLRA